MSTLNWQKSSYCADSSNCLALATAWQQSSHCAEAGNCVNLAASPGGSILLRESEHPEAVLTTKPGPLGAFIRALQAADQPVGTSR